jgi:hypothetical protein
VTAEVDPSTPPSEHEPFPLSVQALDPVGAPSTFNGTVQLEAQWGDVTPTTLTLANGSVQSEVSLNREADPGDVITVRFGDIQAVSAPIIVTPPPLIADGTPVLGADGPFGSANWATQVRYASVYLGAAGHFESVFLGTTASDQAAVGHAVSQDGRGAEFVADSAPVWGPTGAGGFPADIQQPSVFYSADGGQILAYSRVQSQGLDLATFEEGQYVALACDGGSCVAQCAFCNQPGFDPDVLVVPPEVGGSCASAPTWLMYFQALRKVASGGTDISAVGVATSCDGVQFTPYPNPVLVAEDLFSDVVFAPHVLLDGHIFKMWFTYSVAPIDAATFQDFCASTTNAGIGYATSRDGFSWVPSTSNPVLEPSAAPWWQLGATAHTLRVTSVLPTDGVDPKNGISVYYTPDLGSPSDAGVCSPGGLGRAVRG